MELRINEAEKKCFCIMGISAGIIHCENILIILKLGGFFQFTSYCSLNVMGGSYIKWCCLGLTVFPFYKYSTIDAR